MASLGLDSSLEKMKMSLTFSYIECQKLTEKNKFYKFYIGMSNCESILILKQLDIFIQMIR